MNYFKIVGGVIKAHAPEILLGVGLLLEAVAVGTAIAATPSAVEDKKKMEKEGEAIIAARELGHTCTGAEYTELAYRREFPKHVAKTCWEVGKHYIPTVLCFIGGSACCIGSFGVMRARNAAITSIATTAVAALAKYRDNVVAIEGSEKDMLYLEGPGERTTRTEEAVLQEAIVDEDGKMVEEAIVEPVTCNFIDGCTEASIKGTPIAYSPFTIRLDDRFGIYQSTNGNPFIMKNYIEAKLKEIKFVKDKSKDKTITFDEVLTIFGANKHYPEFKDINWQVAKMCISSPSERYFDTQKCKFVNNPEASTDEIDIKNIDDVFLAADDGSYSKTVYYLDFSGFGFHPGCIVV